MPVPPHHFRRTDCCCCCCCCFKPQVHSLIGDYHTGLQCLYPLNIFDKTHLYSPTISSCHITLFYYSSFAYVMLQRYTDAGR